MKFNIFSELSYEVYSSATFIFNIQACRAPNQIIIEESLLINPLLNFDEFTLNKRDSRYIKLEARQGISFTISYQAVVDVQYRIIDETELSQSIPIVQLNTEVLPYLFPSMHCQSDKLRKFASKEFGYIRNEYSKVLAIPDWLFNNKDYITGATDSVTSP